MDILFHSSNVDIRKMSYDESERNITYLKLILFKQ